MEELQELIQNINNGNAEILDLVEKLQNALLEKDIDAAFFLAGAIENAGKNNKETIDICFLEMEAIKHKQLDEAETIRELEEQIQIISSRMSRLDKKLHYKNCEKAYKEDWFKLDEDSREFLVTAKYIFSLVKLNSGDFSPVIIELCRAYENELQAKIFNNYIRKAANKPDLYHNDCDALATAITNIRNNRTAFISLLNMVTILHYLNRAGPEEPYKEDLKNELLNENWNIVGLSDENLYKDGRKYTIDFRNESAHPNRMDEKAAVDCSSMTRSLLSRFINCKNRND